jgi:hypothetical protein
LKNALIEHGHADDPLAATHKGCPRMTTKLTAQYQVRVRFEWLVLAASKYCYLHAYKCCRYHPRLHNKKQTKHIDAQPAAAWKWCSGQPKMQEA